MMATEQTVQEMAEEAFSCFEWAKRQTINRSPDGDDATTEGYVRVKDGSPEWVKELVHHAHGDMIPDDWRYKTIQSALESIADTDDGALEDAAHEWADAECDFWSPDLVAWLGSNGSRIGYCDEAIDNEQWPSSDGTVGLLSAGQYNEAREVYGLVLDYLEKRRAGA